MPDEAEIVTIAINGSVGRRRSWSPQPAGGTPDPDAEHVATLNQEAGSIASDIEREIRKVLGPQYAVQAEISFTRGSIIIEGTIIILSWTGMAALDGVKREIGELVRIPLKRLLGEVLTGIGADASGLEVSATVRSAAPVRSAVALDGSRLSVAPILPLLPRWFQVTILVATIGIVILVLDRLASLSIAHFH